ncbi:MAG: methylenetetrahydrofolate reductase [Chloroflexi bacterium]|nr:methylenetetrahydrofolate reductase [Chloroflexota bacterium]
MRIADAYRNGRPVFSFEFFPPTNEEGMRRLHDTIAALRPVRPDFVSVTYPAVARPSDTARRELTIELVTQIKRDTGIEAMAHLTCSDHTAEQLGRILDRLQAAGVQNVIALRGDPSQGRSTFTPTEGGFAHGSEFAGFIRSRWPFCVAGATYPEPHLESAEPDQDVRYAKVKQDVGVEVLITQLFFEPDDYFRFVRRARALGVSVPIVPGIMPITKVDQLRPTGMFARCGAHVPERLRARIEGARDEEAVQAVGIAWSLGQCRELLEGGAPGIHFYTLNRSRAAYAVYRGLTAAVPAVGAR